MSTISLSAWEKEVPAGVVLGPGLFVESRDGLVKAVQRPLVPFLFPHEHGLIGNALVPSSARAIRPSWGSTALGVGAEFIGVSLFHPMSSEGGG